MGFTELQRTFENIAKVYLTEFVKKIELISNFYFHTED